MVILKTMKELIYQITKEFHIKAVQFMNEMDITSNIKLPTFSELTKNKNNGKVTGLKKSGHKINSVEIPIIAPVNDQEHDESHSEGSNATLTDDCNIYLIQNQLSLESLCTK